MTITINKLKLNYSLNRVNSSGEYFLFLHGFGGSLKSFEGFEKALKNKANIINLDFFGFGKSDTPPVNFTIYDYASYVAEFLKKLKIKKVNIVAHSFGGRVAIILASNFRFLINKMVLIGSAGIKPRFNPKIWLKIKKFKLLLQFVKFKLIKKEVLNKYGSDDYKSLNNDFKQVFKNVISEDLSYLLKKIEAETLLIWGKKDKDTPLYMAKKMKRNIKNSALIIYPKAGHYSYVQEYNKTLLILKSFFGIGV
jgi:pimeloyl-ACP methyl ester carboxylesterase